MMYVDFSAGNKDYKLRLNTRNIVALEKKLGMNPVHIFKTDGSIPPVTTLVNVLHASLQQYNHGITLEDAYDIFDEYLDDGKSPVDFVYVVMDIYRTSGLLPRAKETDEKN